MPYSTPSHSSPSQSTPSHSPPSSSPASTRPSTDASSSTPRAHHRRTRSSGSFTDEKGPGAFVSLGALPRTPKRAAFHITVDDDEDAPPSRSNSPPRHSTGLLSPPSLRLSIDSGRFSPTVDPPSRIELPPPGAVQVPFPTSSPLSPSETDSPFIPRRPASSASTSASTPLPRTPSTPIILSNGKPLKPSLKSSSSSPNIPGLSFRAAHLRAQSAPSTPIYPKAVHFPEDPALESVRVFSRSGKPASLSKAPGDETETETEAEGGANGGGGSYPFPSLAPADPTLYELRTEPGATSAVPAPQPPPYANAHLETLALPRTSPPALRGTVLVRNVAFEKTVAVRFTLDDWQTTSEVLCRHVVSLPGLPPPFASPRTLGDIAGNIVGAREDERCPQWDRFSFVVRLEDYAHKLGERTLFLAVRYTTPAGEWWDNNSGANYRVAFRRAPAPAPTTRFEGSLGLSGLGLASAGASSSPFAAQAHAQQRTFAPPTTLRSTPTTSEVASIAAAIPAVPKRLTAPALTRSHSAPLPGSTPSFAPPPPMRAPPRLPGDDSPVLRFVARRLSLTNYAAPHASPASEAPTADKDNAEKAKEVKDDEAKEKAEMVTPPETPPGSVRARRTALLPAVEPAAAGSERREGAFDASTATNVQMQAPGEDVPLAQPEGAGGPGSPSALSPLLGGLGIAAGMLSPPSSPPRGLGLEIAPEKGEVLEPSSRPTGKVEQDASSSVRPSLPPARPPHLSFNTFPHAMHTRSASAPLASISSTQPPSRSASPMRAFPPSPGAQQQYGVSDPNYAALIRQWCFGGSAGPSTGAYVGGYGRGYGASPAGFGLGAAPDTGIVGAGAHMR